MRMQMGVSAARLNVGSGPRLAFFAITPGNSQRNWRSVNRRNDRGYFQQGLDWSIPVKTRLKVALACLIRS